MTAEAISTIQQLATTMPRYSQRVTRKFSGRQLMDMGYEHWQGGVIYPDRAYMVETIVAVNYVRLLTKVLETKGADAMLDLVHRVRGGQRINTAA